MADNFVHHVEFKASGRGKAQCAPDPNYPAGKSIDISDGARPFCKIALPYPAPECGHFMVTCQACSLKVAITAAGRPDDPISVKLPCNLPPMETIQ